MALATASSPAARCAQIEPELHGTDENSCFSLDYSRDLHLKVRSLRRIPRTQIAKNHTDAAAENATTSNSEPGDNGVNLAKLECETPKSKKHKRGEVTECPPAPMKPRPKRRRQSRISEEYFVPDDLDTLPVDIQALFR